MTLQDPKKQPQQSKFTIQALDTTERWTQITKHKFWQDNLSKRAKRQAPNIRNLPPNAHSIMLNAHTVTKELRIQQKLICTSPMMSSGSIILEYSMDLLRLVAVHLIPSGFQLEPSAPLPMPVAGHERQKPLVKLSYASIELL